MIWEAEGQSGDCILWVTDSWYESRGSRWANNKLRMGSIPEENKPLSSFEKPSLKWYVPPGGGALAQDHSWPSFRLPSDGNYRNMNSVIPDLAVVRGNIRKHIRILFKEKFCFSSNCIIPATVFSLEPFLLYLGGLTFWCKVYTEMVSKNRFNVVRSEFAHAYLYIWQKYVWYQWQKISKWIKVVKCD